MKRPEPDVIKVGPVKGFWATWKGGEYIEVWARREDAAAEARGEILAPSVHVLNTTGDEVGDDRDAYVMTQLREFVEEHGDTYRANI